MLALLGVAAHGHRDACHDSCWLCHSSLGSVGLPAVVITPLIVYAASYICIERIPALVGCDVDLSTSPRAPPQAFSIV